MPRRPIDPIWRERIRVIAAKRPRLGPGPIARELELVAHADHRTDVPSQRTISRVLTGFRNLDPQDQAPYREFLWPDAMERGDLPWEAGEAVFELLAFLDSRDPSERRRPLLGAVIWYWRVTLARPKLDLSTRWLVARFAAANDAGSGLAPTVLEWMLAHAHLEEKPAAEWLGEPIPVSEFSGNPSGGLVDVLEAIAGHPFGPDERRKVESAHEASDLADFMKVVV